MRALVLTNHFAGFSGSEIVSLEVARSFADRGCEVTLAVNHAASPLLEHAGGISVTRDVAALDLSGYDVAWCQHDMLSLLPLSCFERASRDGLPHIALVSLSPYDPYEHVDWTMVRALGADVLANSAETRDEILRRAHGCLAIDDITVFHNAAPSAFWQSASRRPVAPAPARIVVISNRVPAELGQAMQQLTAMGRDVRHIGMQGDYSLVGPADITAADLVIAIGKSVPYAIALSRPVYIYDHFGGDGWLNPANFAGNLYHNFSGRPNTRRLEAADLVREIESGYGDAWSFCGRYGEQADLRLLQLEHHLTALLERAARRPPAERAGVLAGFLDQPRFRAHLETSRHRANVARRSYRMLSGTFDA